MPLHVSILSRRGTYLQLITEFREYRTTVLCFPPADLERDEKVHSDTALLVGDPPLEFHLPGSRSDFPPRSASSMSRSDVTRDRRCLSSRTTPSIFTALNRVPNGELHSAILPPPNTGISPVEVSVIILNYSPRTSPFWRSSKNMSRLPALILFAQQCQPNGSFVLIGTDFILVVVSPGQKRSESCIIKNVAPGA